MPHTFFVPIAMSLFLLQLSAVSFCQPGPPRPATGSAAVANVADNLVLTTAPLFMIAYVRADAESPLDATTFTSLTAYLRKLPSVQTAMQTEGIRDIAVQSADSPQILIDWMSQEQVDLAFCPAVAYTKQEGNYDAVFQLRRARDIVSPSGDRVFHRGVLFVNNRSPLFTAPGGTGLIPQEYLKSKLGPYLADHPIAFVHSFSAAGYFYPYLRLIEIAENTQPQGFFCQSPEEVVKSVVNGVADMGACDGAVIDEVLARSSSELLKNKNRVLRVILETEAIPTDPVAMKEKWRPRGMTGQVSPLGREIRNGLQEFFVLNADLPRLVLSGRDRFEELKQSLERLQKQDAATPSSVP